MSLYWVRVEQRIERVVTVDADSYAQAREMAERGEGGWLDGGKGTSIGVDALDVSRQDDEPDPFDAYDERMELNAS